MQQQLMTSNSEHWCTPPEFLDRITQNFGQIGLDPCSNPASVVPALHKISELMGRDGLKESWVGKGLVYVNPPYGRKIKDWGNKVVSEHRNGVEIISLIPARTDTKWFHESVFDAATAVVFMRGRVKFLDSQTGLKGHAAPFPSAVVYYGSRLKEFRHAFGEAGKLVVLKTPKAANVNTV